MTNTIEKLISNAKELIEKDAKERQCNSADFNIFKITGIQSDEVKMCRMLAEIINPNGTNKKGMFFLKSFIEKVLGVETIGEEELASAKVYTEHHTKTDRRIDIAIVTNKRFIPIEVKIYAEDQARQCRDYYDFAIEQGMPEQSKVYYLTLDGHLPQKSGAEGLTEKTENGEFVGYEEIIPISFRQTIYSWLENCLQELKDDVLIRANIEQYMYVLGELSGKMSEKLNDQITKMISDNVDYFRAACEIEENIKRAKENMLLKLFETLENKLNLAENFPYEHIENVFDYKHNNYEDVKRKFYGRLKTYPGFSFRYKKLDDARDIWFRVEVDNNLYCGFAVAENGENHGIPMTHEEIEQSINIPDDFHTGSWWLYWEYLLQDGRDSIPNFVGTNEALKKLFDKEYFNEFTDKCVARIIELAEHMKK